MRLQFEMSIIVAKIQHGGLAPKLGAVADQVIELVKQQIEQRIKSPHIGGGPIVNFAWEYFVCLRDWQEAKRIYRRNRNSTSWRKCIKDESPDLPVDLILSTGDAARRLNVSSEFIRKLERSGKLAAMRTAGGQRIFKAEDIEFLASKREKQRSEKPNRANTGKGK
jgi:excisionase family DNA binding protein